MIFFNFYYIIVWRVVLNYVVFNVIFVFILEIVGILIVGLVGFYVELVLKDYCMYYERNIFDCFVRDIDFIFWEFGYRLFYEGKIVFFF